jgi:hypothetical protein
MSKARKERLPHKAFPQRPGSVNGRDTWVPWVYGCRYEISNNKRRQDQHVVDSSSVDLAQADDIPDGPYFGPLISGVPPGATPPFTYSRKAQV